MKYISDDYIIIEEDTDIPETEQEEVSANTDENNIPESEPSINDTLNEEIIDDTPKPPASEESEISPYSDDDDDEDEEEEETISIDTMLDPLDDYADEEEAVNNQNQPEDDEEMIDIDFSNGLKGFEDDNTDTATNQPAPQTIDIGINVANFGSDNSPVQNQYNPKEIERLNELVASENSAIGEYFQASKDTNVDVLRRLYSDIGEEERFHVEQLLFAKSQITGERYIPRDPNIKKEYEELLSMGMDEETAMNTAVDRVGLINKSAYVTPEESVQEMDEIIDEIELIQRLCYQEYMLYKINESACTYSTRERDKAMGVFIEAYINEQFDSPEMILEDVANVSEPQPKVVNNNNNGNEGGIIKGIGRFFKGIASAIGKLFGAVITFIRKRAQHLRSKINWLKNHKLTDIFKHGFHLYFYNDSGAKAGFAYDDAAKYLIRLINCCIWIARDCKVAYNFSPNQMKFKQLVEDNYAASTIEEAVNNIKKVTLVKTKVIINEHNQKLFLNEAFGIGTGNTSNNIKPTGAFSKFSMLLEDFKNAADAASNMITSMENLPNTKGSIFYTNKDQYRKLIGYLKDVTKGFKMFMDCITHDINVLTKIDNEFTRVASQAPGAQMQQAAPAAAAVPQQNLVANKVPAGS